MRMAEPAPKVESVMASAVELRVAELAPIVESPSAASAVKSTAAAPSVEPAVAEPPPSVSILRVSAAERAEETSSTPAAAAAATAAPTGSDRHRRTRAEALRAAKRVLFEGPAAVVVGPVEKDVCQKWVPCFDERSFVSFGEVKRHILVAEAQVFVYLDETDASPLYTVPLSDLAAEREDPDDPDFYSHTISPEANTGFRTPMFANRSRESLESILLRDKKGKIAFQFAFDKNVSGLDVVDKFVSAVKSSEMAER